MLKEEIIEGNKAIAEFVGWTKRGNRFEMSWTYHDDNGDEHEANRSIKDTEFKYHENWSQLMPVVEKIESLGYWVTTMPYQCQIYKAEGNFCGEIIIDADFRSTRLENTFDGVISFIKWYNTKTP